MGNAPPSVVVTGISGNLGRRLLPLLGGFRVIGVDFRPPVTDHSLQFEQMDLGEEASCMQLLQLLRDTRPVAVAHLAFVMDAVRTGILPFQTTPTPFCGSLNRAWTCAANMPVTSRKPPEPHFPAGSTMRSMMRVELRRVSGRCSRKAHPTRLSIRFRRLAHGQWPAMTDGPPLPFSVRP